MARVSIVIPCYNQAAYAAEAIESALAQSHPEIEVIAVDDGSTDETPAVLAAYAGRIRVISQANRGLAGARNSGLCAASGDYLLFLDSDDTIAPTMVARLASLLDAHPGWGLAYAAWQQVSADGKRVLGEARPRPSAALLEGLLRREFFFFASAALIRRECFERVGPFDEALPWGEDADMWLRLALAGYGFGYCDELLLRYRVHPESMSAGVSPRQVASWQSGLDKFFGRPDLPPAVRALAAEARAILHYETAGRYYRRGEVAAAQAQLREALRLIPDPERGRLLGWLIGTALDPRTTDPIGLIELVCATLPAELAARLPRRAARASYHIACAFAAGQRHDFAAARPHLWPAISGRPEILANRGFLRLALAALLAQRPQPSIAAM